MNSRIYFLRHGQVQNPRQILYGRLPGFSLSKLGREEIIDCAKKLENKYISFIYTSSLSRTRETAEIFAKKLHIAPIVLDLLLEVKLFCEGVSIKEYHDKIQFDLYNEKNIKMGQESIEVIETRMMEFVNLVLKKHPNTSILAVSHGDPIMILKAKLSGVKFDWKYKKNNYLGTGKYFTLVIKNGNYFWS